MTTINPYFECQKRISNVKIRYSVPIRIPKQYSECQSMIFGASWNVKIGLRMSKFDIRSQFECQHKISNVKISHSARVLKGDHSQKVMQRVEVQSQRIKACCADCMSKNTAKSIWNTYCSSRINCHIFSAQPKIQHLCIYPRNPSI